MGVGAPVVSALSEALEAAQTRAVAVLAKQYVGGTRAAEQVDEALVAIGLTDDVDAKRWFAALDVIRDGGGDAPAETNGKAKQSATDKQKDYIAKLCQEKNQPYPDDVRTKDEAHEIIESLQAGTYDPARWRVPF